MQVGSPDGDDGPDAARYGDGPPGVRDGGADPDAFLSRSLRAAAVGGWEWDPGADVFRWTPRTAGLVAAAADRGPLGLGEFLAYVHPADRAELERTLHGSLAEGRRFRTQFRMSDPITGSVDGMGTPDGGAAVGAAPAGRSDVLAGRGRDGLAAPPAGTGTRDAEVDDGSRIVRMVGAPGTGAAVGTLAGVIEDVTDATRARRAVNQTEHLASLGQLAAGLAHDFNNLLTVVTMRADMLRSAAPSQPPVAEVEEDATAILQAADRASALTRQLMLFAGHQAANPVELAVAEIVDGLRPLVDAMRDDVFGTEYDLAPTPPVSGERLQLEQIVVSLALNARDALREVPRPAGRPLTLSIRVRAAEPGAAELVPRGDRVRAGHSWVVLEVADTGAGMAPATAARARDPFFTTKPIGVGTGLGLSVVHGLAEQLGGWLAIDSERGAGTTVRVVLPAAAPTVPVSTRRDRPPAMAGTHVRPLVVVVDDDDAVRSVTSRSLQRHGFEVVTATGAKEALEAIEARPGVAALVSDVVMPGMSGVELAARILADYPRIPVLLVTGYAPPGSLPSSPRLALVTKPLTGAGLASSLRELLAAVDRDRPGT